MNVFITGGSGFVGTNFIQNTPNFNHTIIDLLTQKVENIDFTTADCVLHLAALVHQMKGAPKEKYFEINSELAFKTAQKAKNDRVKHFIFLSTIKVYGENTTTNNAWTENTICYPTDDYGRSKLEAEQRIATLADDNFKIAIIRSPLIYGKGVKGNMDSLIELINKYNYFPFKNTGNKRSFVSTKNLSALISQIIEKRAEGIFLASDGNSISTEELIRLIALHSNKNIKLLQISKFVLYFIKIMAQSKYDRLWGNLEINPVNYAKINFTPPYSVNDGIKEMVDWYKRNRKIS